MSQLPAEIPPRPVRFEPQANRRKADAWMDANPAIVTECLNVARAMLQRNHTHVAIAAIREEVRLSSLSHGTAEYKFCTTHSPYVARWLLLMEPRLVGCLHCRRADDEWHLPINHIITRADGESPWVVLALPAEGD